MEEGTEGEAADSLWDWHRVLEMRYNGRGAALSDRAVTVILEVAVATWVQVQVTWEDFPGKYSQDSWEGKEAPIVDRGAAPGS